MKTYKKDPNAPSAEDKALEKFADMIVSKIESLTKGKWDKPWFESNGMLAENIEGRLYSGFNQLFLLFCSEGKGFKAPIFATFDRIMKFNYDKDGKYVATKENKVSVIKGETAFPVFCTTYKIIHRETKETITMTEYLNLSEEEKKDYKVFPNQKVYNVFNIDQTNLSEVRPELYQKLIEKNKVKECTDEGKFKFKKMDDLIKQQGWVCPINVKKSDRAFFSPSGDYIVVPEFKQFKTGEAFYSTTIHEMAHSTGHKDRLNRLEEGVGFGSAAYGREELVAELTAALVCHMYGIQNGVQEESCQYLKSWCKSIHEDPKFIKTVLNDVKKASDMIRKYIDNIE